MTEVEKATLVAQARAAMVARPCRAFEAMRLLKRAGWGRPRRVEFVRTYVINSRLSKVIRP